MNATLENTIEPGTVLAGKFRIEKVLGQGGMGVVVAATHLQLQQQVALKFLLPDALKNAEAVRRFEREARAAVRIKSEHVARVTDVGTLESGAPYMVMEYLSGMDLSDYLSASGPLPFDEAALYILQACEAIAEAHSIGIVHRDLKPANLFRIIRSDGSPSIKVLDFGISKITSDSEPSMTQTSSMMGSPYYMSPEQMTSSKNVDIRTDIWALGIILHELLTGRVPYEGQTIPEICVQVLQNAPPRLQDIRADAPIEISQTIDTALAKNREERFQNIAEFAGALAPFCPKEGQRSVERISKVLGVAYPILKTGLNSDRGAPQTDAIASTQAMLAASHTEPLAADAASTSSPQSMNRKGNTTTLGGAAHTQLDYHVPKKGKIGTALLVAALFLLAGGSGFAFMIANSSSSVSPAAQVPPADNSTPEDTGGGNEAVPIKKEQAAASPTERGTQHEADSTDQAKALEANSKKESEKEARTETVLRSATSPQTTAPKKAPSSAARRRAAKSPRAARTSDVPAKPSPAPIRTTLPPPKPAPKPTPKTNLYMDRK